MKLRSHISVLRHFCKLAVISEYPFYGIGPKKKTQKLRRIFIFGSTNLKQICTCFLIIIVTFWMLNEHKQRVLLNLSNKKPLTSNLYDSRQILSQCCQHTIYFSNYCMDLSESWVFTITTVAQGAIKLGSDTPVLKIKNIIFWRMWYDAAKTFLP